MNDRDTTVLTSRLHRLADDMTPPLDVIGQVRAARARHQKQRRGRIALIAAATATAAVVLGTTGLIGQLSVAPQRGEVAVPSRSVPTTAERTPTPPARSTEPPPVAPPPRTETGARWPAEAADLRTGGSFSVVFVAVVPWAESSSLVPLAQELRDLGYNAGIGEACATLADGGELPFDWNTQPQTVSVYFDTDQTAQQFVASYEAKFDRQVVGVFRVRPACL